MTAEYAIGSYTTQLTALDHLLGDGNHHLRLLAGAVTRTAPSTRSTTGGHIKSRMSHGPREAALVVRRPTRCRPSRGVRVRIARDARSTPWLLLVWSQLLGIPNDTVQVFLWLWLGTIAWNIEAPPRYHLRFLRDWWLPVVGLVIYFYSRGLTDELGPARAHHDADPRRRVARSAAALPTERLQDAWCGDPCLKDSEPALVRRLLHHRLRHALPGRADHRRGAVGAQARASGCCGCAAT